MGDRNLGYRQKCLSQKINACNNCGTGEDLVVHHINGDRDDNRLENLVPLCKPCHSHLHTAAEVTGALAELREKLPDSTISWGGGMDNPTSIRVTSSTWSELNRRKRPGDSFNDVISRLFGSGGAAETA